MKLIRGIEFCAGSREERLPDFAPDFPYIASRVEMDFYPERFVPWHWHSAVEIFYMESGSLEYSTPQGKAVFPQGSGGFVNSNVLHRTEIRTQSERNVQLLHIFDPRLLAGSHASAIEQKYIMPVVASPQIELLALQPEVPEQAAVIDRIRGAFRLSEDALGYEIRIRDALSQIWLQLFGPQLPALWEKAQSADRSADKVKRMMIYIHEHYAEKITVSALAKPLF